MKLRPLYQQPDFDAVHDLWTVGFKNVLLVEPTGGGKTVIFCKVIHDHQGASVAIAHRHELVTQISMSLAAQGIRHRVIGGKKTVKWLNFCHERKFGKSFVDPNAWNAVASVDTLIGKSARRNYANWFPQVTLWVQDEAHHVLCGNKWGNAAELFPNAKGLGVTATPTRADGKGLGRHADGLFDVMHVGPPMRQLIEWGYLTDYTDTNGRTHIFCPPSDMDFSGQKVGSTGDYNPKQLRAVAQDSHIVGDVVDHYMRLAPGRLGITFAPDVETATDIANKFNAAGIPAKMVCGETPDDERIKAMEAFERRELLQLVNVDLFGEGTDVPALEVVSFARKTESYSLYAQQFGRVLRLGIDPSLYATWDSLTSDQRRWHISQSKKPHAVIIDHVGNVLRHGGPPDEHREWTLDGRDKRSSGRSDALPMKACSECLRPYMSYKKSCPNCGHTPEPAARTAPEFVDGDLLELDAATLAKLRADKNKIDGAPNLPTGAGSLAVAGAINRHAEKQESQAQLRDWISWWAGVHNHLGHDESESYRIFYQRFGLDVLSAQGLPRADADKLARKVSTDVERLAAKHQLTGA